MLENLERLNRKIAELEGQSPSALSLNEQAEERNSICRIL